jgi:PIN domain nuclease of toxin-antitoxin system
MTYLLDTVAFLRALDNTLPAKIRRQLQRANAQLFVSIITPWEIALKRSLHFAGVSNELVQQYILDLGARILPISVRHIGKLYSLPPLHRDPFERMLIAQALEERYPIVSSDRHFGLYREVGLEVIWD